MFQFIISFLKPTVKQIIILVEKVKEQLELYDAGPLRYKEADRER